MILCVGATPAVQRVMIFKALEIDHVNRAAETLEGIAGKSVNVAKVLRAMGQEVVATGFLGGGRGAFIRGQLEMLGVGSDFLEVTPQTRMCVTVIDRAAGKHTELVEESRAVEEANYIELERKVFSLLAGAKLLILSGTLTPGAPADFYLRCVTAAAQRGIRSIVDTQGEVFRRTLPARPFLVKPNRAELGAALGVGVETQAQVVDAMKRLLSEGVSSVVISMGAEGALAGDASGFWRLSVPRIQAVNPIGSGDSVTAGIASGLVRGLSFVECCRLGMACGVANALTMMAGEVRPDDVDKILPQVTAESL